MKQAPAVGVTLSGAGAWRWLHVLLAAAAGGALALWALLHLMQPGWFALGAAGAAALSAWRLVRPQPAHLAWDGEAWRLDGVPVAADLMLDLPRWLLLRLRALPGGAVAGTRWLAVPAAEAGPAWRALRAALYSPAAHAPPTASRMPVRPPD
ncbi:hypothetical protein ACPOLB_11680 [Rubrivivax sp. RP6-9]|uniref:hypothetical protein n=1 Tax=Rubrivivax sp. RP6-9 TaxID=3415750 RepID=UPI003CC5E67D